MITKKEGAEDKCPSCKQVLVCREVTYKEEKKLQWQYQDKEVAHFSYDFKTGKSACKESSGSSVQTGTNSASQDTVNLDGMSLPADQIAAITQDAEELTERQLAILVGVKRVCGKAGIGHPATVGMIYNQVCETRRYKGV